MAATSTKQPLIRIPLNTTDIDQSLLNIERKERSNPLPWNGQFSPQLVEILLGKYAPGTGCVLDPFAGSGTILLEAANRNVEAIGADINPAACYLARIYTLASRPRNSRLKLCDQFGGLLEEHFPPELPLFRGSVNKVILEDRRALLSPLRERLGKSEGTVLLAALLVLCDFFGGKADRGQLFQAWKRLRAIVLSLTESNRRIKVFNADARKLPIQDSQVGLVITSPPYVNVFNYHQHFRQTAEALGWHLLRVARAEIGSNRKHRANRFLTVIQYCMDMAQVFEELRRVCKPRSRVIFVVGRESRVRGLPFYNGRLIASVGEAATFELATRQERVFTNRFGQSIFEDILHFNAPQRPGAASLEMARTTAIKSLNEALECAAGDVRRDVLEAIKTASKVRPSPIYDKAEAFGEAVRPNGANS
jgi:SAM-dependent methyltransferase